MFIMKHGIYYDDFVEIKCKKCECVYEIDKNDIKHYSKPKKVRQCFFDDIWAEKYEYYTLCPECGYDNELSYRNYDILTTDVIKKGE